MRFRALPLLLFFVVLAITFYSMTNPNATLFSFSPFQAADTLRISPEEARRRRFALILDVRTPKERELAGFYPNSLPVDPTPSSLAQEIPFLLGEKPGHVRPSTPRNTPLLVYSNAGEGRARQAAETLYDLGFIGTRYLSTSYLDMLPPGNSVSLH